MVAPIAAGARAAGATSIAYVMTDGAALPGALSRLVPRLRETGLLDGWLTTGQAFGGELDAVTLWSGLLAAVEVLAADVVIVADGPGNLGTDTTWGVSALASGHAAERGRRPRRTAGGGAPRVVRRRPRPPPGALASLRHDPRAGLCRSNQRRRPRAGRRPAHRDLGRATRPETGGAASARRDRTAGPPWTSSIAAASRSQSMGRTPADDPAFFLAAGAAGVLAGRMAAGSQAWRDGTRGS